MIYMGKLARREHNDVVRKSVFKEGSIELIDVPYKRRRGRPRQSWGPIIYNACLETAGDIDKLQRYFSNEKGMENQWKHIVTTRSPSDPSALLVR